MKIQYLAIFLLVLGSCNIKQKYVDVPFEEKEIKDWDKSTLV